MGAHGRRCGSPTGIHPHQAGDAGDAADGATCASVATSARVRSAKSASTTTTTSRRATSSSDDLRGAGGSARELRLPVVIHTREATDDTFDILREEGAGEVRGVFHCFTGDEAMARRALELDFYLSFAGIVTFPRAEAIRGRGADHAGRSAPGRNRCALSRARPAPRQAQRAGACREVVASSREIRGVATTIWRAGEPQFHRALRKFERKLLSSNGLAR